MKRLSTLGLVLLAGPVLSRVLQPRATASGVSPPPLGNPVSNFTFIHHNTTWLTPYPGSNEDDWDVEFGEANARFTEQQRNDIWENAVCKGEKLLRAMMLDENEARELLKWPYVQSPWDGDLKEELKKWGYKESDQRPGGVLDMQCDFDGTHRIGSAFKALDINDKPAGDGGRNRCYQFSHRDGPAVIRLPNGSLPPDSQQYYEVDGWRYRITDAFSKIGINAQDGLIAFLHRISPKHAAATLWNREQINDNELPKLRATSDLAWGMWYRETTEENRKNIKYFLAASVVNEETIVIVSRALGLKNPEGYGGTPKWPGKDFVFYDEENGSDEQTKAAHALLGSNNGLAVGYFLNQHKRQLGGTKFVWKIKIFTTDTGTTGIPNILFYVDNGEHVPPDQQPDEVGGPSEKKRLHRRGWRPGKSKL